MATAAAAQTAKNLTERQARVLELLQRDYGDGSVINPREVFPTRDAQGNADRKAIDALARLGYLEHHPETPAWAIAYRLVVRGGPERPEFTVRLTVRGRAVVAAMRVREQLEREDAERRKRDANMGGALLDCLRGW